MVEPYASKGKKLGIKEHCFTIIWLLTFCALLLNGEEK
jgi:hypothetical protein